MLLFLLMTGRKIHVTKRIFDIACSVVILTATSPLILLVLVLIKIEQILRGRPFDPFFYHETRMSYGQEFTLYKFNIFKYEQILAARAQGKFIHTKHFEHNNGTIRMGWILKQIYMDEIPQFFSVLTGALSVVGPRPVNLEVYKLLMDQSITDKNRVPGGITGNYQSHKETEGASSHDLDREYADFYHTQSGWAVLQFDLEIIFRTLGVILRAKGI